MRRRHGAVPLRREGVPPSDAPVRARTRVAYLSYGKHRQATLHAARMEGETPSLRRVSHWNPIHLCALVVAGVVAATRVDAVSPPCVDPDYRHGISYVEPLHYGAEFRHFDYANPDAPKGGRIRLPQMGTFDNFNAIVEAGRMAAGYGAMGSLVYDTLLEDTIDEPASAYVRLADGVAVEQDYRWVAFRLRAGARWHDGRPLTTEDVVFTFEAIREHGSVALRTALADLDRIETFGARELCFVTRPEAEPNPILPFQYGRIAILPKHYWQEPSARGSARGLPSKREPAVG